MKSLKKAIFPTLAAAGLLISTTAQAQDCPAGAACTDPVGFITLTANPSNDGVSKKITLMGLGLFNPVEFQGAVDSVSVSGTTVLGVTGIQAAAFDGMYFVEVASGDNEGLFVDILSTSADSITLAQDIGSMISVDDVIKIRKHHTIASVFGAGNDIGFTASTNPANADTITVFGATETKTYFYFGSNIWTDGAAVANDVILYPDQGLVIRRIGTGDATIKLLGSVKTGTAGITVESGFNVVSNVFPTDVTLANSGLNTQDGGATGILAGSSPTTADTIRIIDDTGAVKIYFLFNETNNTWTDGVSLANDVVIKAGSSFVWDRRGGSINWYQSQTF